MAATESTQRAPRSPCPDSTSLGSVITERLLPELCSTQREYQFSKSIMVGCGGSSWRALGRVGGGGSAFPPMDRKVINILGHDV